MQTMTKPSSAAVTLPCSAHIIFGESITLDGITNISESDDKTIIANMGENSLQIYGDKLNIDMLDTTGKKATISGSVHILKYSKGKEKLSFIKKLIK